MLHHNAGVIHLAILVKNFMSRGTRLHVDLRHGAKRPVVAIAEYENRKGCHFLQRPGEAKTQLDASVMREDLALFDSHKTGTLFVAQRRMRFVHDARIKADRLHSRGIEFDDGCAAE